MSQISVPTYFLAQIFAALIRISLAQPYARFIIQTKKLVEHYLGAKLANEFCLVCHIYESRMEFSSQSQAMRCDVTGLQVKLGLGPNEGPLGYHSEIELYIIF